MRPVIDERTIGVCAGRPQASGRVGIGNTGQAGGAGFFGRFPVRLRLRERLPRCAGARVRTAGGARRLRSKTSRGLELRSAIGPRTCSRPGGGARGRPDGGPVGWSRTATIGDRHVVGMPAAAQRQRGNRRGRMACLGRRWGNQDGSVRLPPSLGQLWRTGRAAAPARQLFGARPRTIGGEGRNPPENPRPANRNTISSNILSTLGVLVIACFFRCFLIASSRLPGCPANAREVRIQVNWWNRVARGRHAGVGQIQPLMCRRTAAARPKRRTLPDALAIAHGKGQSLLPGVWGALGPI